MSQYVIKSALVINRGESSVQDVQIKNGRIHRIDNSIDDKTGTIIDGRGLWLIPGIIDDQVHFREPGLTHKANIFTESRAAVAGGVTSFMEMPNTIPSSTTQVELQKKYDTASNDAWCNYSFYMGAANDNYEEVMRTSSEDVCGVKIFMGSSTGNMLVDNEKVLEKLFENVSMLIATHCEDEATIRRNIELKRQQYQDKIPMWEHPIIRSREACFLSSSRAVSMAKKYGTRLHILHISTAEELDLFDNSIPLKEKKISSELCVHHMYFNDSYYGTLGSKLKCNPAIKKRSDQEALLAGLLDDRLDVLATDHAPHTIEEKNGGYLSAPSGLPLVQHSLNIVLDFYHRGLISKEKLVEKMCHAPADLFRIQDRGYIDEGMMADVVLVNPQEQWTVIPSNIAYKCGWSPLEGIQMKGNVKKTFVNGNLVYDDGKFIKPGHGLRMKFGSF